MKPMLLFLLAAAACASPVEAPEPAGEEPAPVPVSAPRPLPTRFVRGLNLYGGFQNHCCGRWAFPSDAQLAYYARKGFTHFRMPILWENVQPALFAPLEPVYLAAIDRVFAQARRLGLRIAIVPINHGVYPYGGDAIGTPQVPAEAFYDLWTKLATRFVEEPALWGYGLMNEPFRDKQWAAHAQGAIDAIRAVDRAHTIMVPPLTGTLPYWLRDAETLNVSDPADDLLHELHVYFDKGSTGRYTGGGYEAEGAYPAVGVDRIRAIVEWCKRRGKRLYIGEFGVPGGWQGGNSAATFGPAESDPRWNEVLERFLSYLDAEGVSATYWNAGPYGDVNSVEPNDRGEERPQMSVLTRHPGR